MMVSLVTVALRSTILPTRVLMVVIGVVMATMLLVKLPWDVPVPK